MVDPFWRPKWEVSHFLKRKIFNILLIPFSTNFTKLPLFSFSLPSILRFFSLLSFYVFLFSSSFFLFFFFFLFLSCSLLLWRAPRFNILSCSSIFFHELQDTASSASKIVPRSIEVAERDGCWRVRQRRAWKWRASERDESNPEEKGERRARLAILHSREFRFSNSPGVEVSKELKKPSFSKLKKSSENCNHDFKLG